VEGEEVGPTLGTHKTTRNWNNIIDSILTNSLNRYSYLPLNILLPHDCLLLATTSFLLYDPLVRTSVETRSFHAGTVDTYSAATHTHTHTQAVINTMRVVVVVVVPVLVFSKSSLGLTVTVAPPPP